MLPLTELATSSRKRQAPEAPQEDEWSQYLYPKKNRPNEQFGEYVDPHQHQGYENGWMDPAWNYQQPPQQQPPQHQQQPPQHQQQPPQHQQQPPQHQQQPPQHQQQPPQHQQHPPQHQQQPEPYYPDQEFTEFFGFPPPFALPPVQYDPAPLQPVQHQPVQQQPTLQQQQPLQQPPLQPLQQQQHHHYPQQVDQQQHQYAPYPPQYGYQNMQTQPQQFQTPSQQQQQFQNQQDQQQQQQQQQFQPQQHFQPQQQESPSDSTPGLGNDSLSTVGSVANVSLSTVGSVVSTVSVPPARIEKKENLGKMTNAERNKQRTTMLKKEFGEWWSRRATRNREYPGSRPNFDMSKDHEIMETVGGRLAIVGNMTKYTLTVEELRRRIEGAESMNISELNCLFRKGKKKNGGEDLRRTLWDSYGIEIKNSQRHSILQSKFTPILEGEARVMANDVDQMTKQHFPTDALSEMIYEYMLNVTAPTEMLKQVKGCLNTLERIIDVANRCKPKIVGEMEYKSGFDPLDEKMEFYSNRTHGFGVVNMNTWFMAVYKTMQLVKQRVEHEVGRRALIPSRYIAVEPDYFLEGNNFQ